MVQGTQTESEYICACELSFRSMTYVGGARRGSMLHEGSRICSDFLPYRNVVLTRFYKMLLDGFLLNLKTSEYKQTL